MKRTLLSRLLATVVILSFSFGTGLFQSASAKTKTIETSMAVFWFSTGKEEFPVDTGYTKLFAATLMKSTYLATVQPADVRRLLSKEAMRMSGVTDTQLNSFRAELNAAADLLIKNTRAAIIQLEKNIATLDALNVRVVYSALLQKIIFRSYMLLARAYHDIGDKKQMRNVLRKVMWQVGVGGARVTEDEYHPGLVTGWNRVKAELQKLRTANLKVASKKPGAAIYLQGRRLSQVTPTTITGLLPGPVQLELRHGDRRSMSRTVNLAANATKSVSIDVAFESSIGTKGGRLGFRFASPLTFDMNHVKYAVRLGKLLDVDTVMLCGLSRANNDTRFVAVLIDIGRAKVIRKRSGAASKAAVKTNAVVNLADEMLTGVVVPMRLPLTKNWLGWTGAGLSLLSFIIAPVMWNSAVADHQVVEDCKITDTAGNVVISPNCGRTKPELDELAASAEGKYSTSIAFYVIGGVFAAGSILAFTLLKSRGWSRTAQAPPARGLKLKALGPTTLPGGSPGLGAHFSF